MSKVDTELAWAAGFFDGEGTAYPVFSKWQGRTYPTFRMQVSQHGDYALALLERFQTAIGGAGKIYGPCCGAATAPSRKPHWKPRYIWTIQGIVKCQSVYSQLWSFLGPCKRDQIFTAVQPALDHLRKVKT